MTWNAKPADARKAAVQRAIAEVPNCWGPAGIAPTAELPPQDQEPTG